MSKIHNFRSSLGGFNRQDVVNYIEYINNRHASEMEQLSNELRNSQDKALLARLEAAEARCRELEAMLENGEAPACKEQELEAYRRAEYAERMAKERADQVYRQANAVLADATVKAEEAAAHIGNVVDEMSAQLRNCQASVDAAKASFREAVDAMYAIRPEEV